MFFNKNTDKGIVICSHKGISHSNNKDELLIHATKLITLKNIMMSDGGQTQEHKLLDFVFMN